MTWLERHQVEWITLRDLAGDGLFSDGDWVESKDQDPAGKVRLTQLADVGIGVFRDRSDRWMREDQASSLGCTFLEPDDVLIARMPDPLGRACQVPSDIGRAVTVVDVAILRCARPGVLSRYVMHAINSKTVNKQILSFQTGGTRQRISRTNLGTIRIPVPTLEVQKEIIRVLDELGEFEQELRSHLNSEVRARMAQYSKWRDRLLSFDGVAMTPFGEVARVVRGASPRPIKAFIADTNEGVPWIKIGDVPAGSKYITKTAERITSEGAQKSRMVHPGDFVLSNSMSFGRPYILKIEGCIHDGWLAISDFDASFTPDFLYHLLRSKAMQAEFARRAGSGTVQNLNADIVRSVIVPIPPLDQQRHVVRILDQLEALVGELTEALLTEAAFRRKQYEHYRDQLFAFEELAA